MKDKNSKHKPQPYHMKIPAGMPISMTQIDDISYDPTDEQLKIGKAIGLTIRSYMKTVKELLKNKYSNIRDYAPSHLSIPGMVFIFCCTDGIIIRYDSNPESKVAVCYSNLSLSEFVPKISEEVVNCHIDRDSESNHPAKGVELTLFAVDMNSGVQNKLFSVNIRYDIVVEQPAGPLPSPPAKPYCLLSINNTMEIRLLGESLASENSSKTGKRFMMCTPLTLPVGWSCIEVFPNTDPKYWKPKYAPIWAENDLLAAVVRRQVQENKLNTLDPKAESRMQFAKLLQSYQQLLDSDPNKEEILQNFLKENPVLLCPAHIQIWPKLALGAHKTDFVFQDAIGDYLLVELEKSIDPLFLKNGDRSHALKHAQDQVSDWRRYIEDNPTTVRSELGLKGISSNPRSLIVIGRSNSLMPKDRRILQTMENESPRSKIMTYDDLYHSTKVIIENLLGPLWEEMGNTRIYFLTDKE
ncbi:Shedu anti-phage system protein SduA domain-containing protein [Chloroflexota bacterium]